jgi:hypothetical protein
MDNLELFLFQHSFKSLGDIERIVEQHNEHKEALKTLVAKVLELKPHISLMSKDDYEVVKEHLFEGFYFDENEMLQDKIMYVSYSLKNGYMLDGDVLNFVIMYILRDTDRKAKIEEILNS